MSYDYDIEDAANKLSCDLFDATNLHILDTKDGITSANISDGMGGSIRINLTQMTAFEIEPIRFEGLDEHFDFNITTKFKNDTACKGFAFTQTCTLHQGLVEYSVILKNNSISLRYPHWQNDSFLQDLSSDLRADGILWTRAFMNLYEVFGFNQSQAYCNETIGFSRWYTRCPEMMTGLGIDQAMECDYTLGDTPLTFRESMSFENENVVGKDCERTWRNPMQVM